MTPERVAEIAEAAWIQPHYRPLDVAIERAIRQAVNEFAEEIVAMVEEHARQYPPVNAAPLEQARRSIRARKGEHDEQH